VNFKMPKRLAISNGGSNRLSFSYPSLLKKKDVKRTNLYCALNIWTTVLLRKNPLTVLDRLFFSSFIFITESRVNLQMTMTMQIKLNRQQKKSLSFFRAKGRLYVGMNVCYGAFMHLLFSAACIFHHGACNIK
jgi:hypothetical protein